MQTWKASQHNPLDPTLLELALDIVEKGEITLKTDKGWFDYAELYIYRHHDLFECGLTTYEEGRTFTGPGHLDPPETEWRETTHNGSFRKIREVAEWAKQHHFEIANSWRKI